MPPHDGHPADASGRDSLRVLYSKGFSPAQLGEALAAHDEAMAEGRDVLKDGARTAVTRVRCGDQWVAVKEYRGTERFADVKRFLGVCRLSRAWHGARVLRRKDIAMPQVIAVVRRGATGYLMTEFLEGTTALNELLLKRFDSAVSGAELAAKDALLDQLGVWLRSIHAQGVYHDDWSAKNFRAGVQAGQWVFYLLDFESVSAWKWRFLTYRRRVKNLAQILDPRCGLTKADVERLLTAYAAGDSEFLSESFRGDVERAITDRVTGLL
jgi:tRNA A-37 threonylcarbamoyl transferase component Bud32